MRGQFVNDGETKATLKVTADTMVVSGGPLVITASYKVVGVTNDTVTVELSAPGTPKGNMVVQVLADSLVIQDSFIFGGKWKRQ
jgi:hypothetical protein